MSVFYLIKINENSVTNHLDRNQSQQQQKLHQSQQQPQQLRQVNSQQRLSNRDLDNENDTHLHLAQLTRNSLKAAQTLVEVGYLK
jgi:hypothetical protein